MKLMAAPVIKLIGNPFSPSSHTPPLYSGHVWARVRLRLWYLNATMQYASLSRRISTRCVRFATERLSKAPTKLCVWSAQPSLTQHQHLYIRTIAVRDIILAMHSLSSSFVHTNPRPGLHLYGLACTSIIKYNRNRLVVEPLQANNTFTPSLPAANSVHVHPLSNLRLFHALYLFVL